MRRGFFMNRNWKIILAAIVLIGIVVAAVLFNKHVQENEAIKENEELHRQYKQASSHMYMELDESVYEQTGNPEDLVLSPTEMTFDLFNRWKFISENYQEINYPEELINQGDWVQVRKTLGEQSLTMEDVSIKISEEYEVNPDKKIQCLSTTIFIIMIV